MNNGGKLLIMLVVILLTACNNNTQTKTFYMPEKIQREIKSEILKIFHNNKQKSYTPIEYSTLICV